MNKYQKLIKNINNKIQTYETVQEENLYIKSILLQQISASENKLSSINKLTSQKDQILNKLLSADHEIAKETKDLQTLKKFGIILGICLGILAFFIAGYYKAPLISKIVTMVITSITTGSISILCDWVRANKVIKPLKEYQAKYNAEQIEDELDDLAFAKRDIKAVLDSKKKKLRKKDDDIEKLNELIAELYSNLDSVMSAFDYTKYTLGRNSSQKRIDERFANDEVIKEIQILKREKSSERK